MTTYSKPAEYGQPSPEVQCGQVPSFSALLDYQAPFLEEQVAKTLGARLREVVEPDDVLQEVRIRVLRSGDRVRFESPARLRGWLAALVRNCIVDLHRRHFRTARRASSPRSLDETDSSAMTLGMGLRAQQSGPSSIARSSERQVLLQRILGDLRPEQRRLLERVHFDHQPLAEIAAQDGATAGALRMRYRRAIESCRRAMAQRTHGADA